MQFAKSSELCYNIKPTKGELVMNEAINATKKMIEAQVDAQKIMMMGIPFSEYQRVYKDTNENIDGYMNLMALEGKENALTVLASGDHAFNLAYHGISNIETFDTNRLTEYYSLGLKRAAILKYDYAGYLYFMRKIVDKATPLEELTELVRGLFPYMESKTYIYWQYVVEYNYQIQKQSSDPLNLFQMILINIQKEEMAIAKNTYLKNKDHYNILKANLKKVEISFQCCDCMNLDSVFKSQYDLLFLSNIADYFDKSFGLYWKYNKLKKYEERLLKIMKENGQIALAYLISCYSLSTGNFRTYPVLSSKLKIADLDQKETLIFSHIDSGVPSDKIKDGLILRKVT